VSHARGPTRSPVAPGPAPAGGAGAALARAGFAAAVGVQLVVLYAPSAPGVEPFPRSDLVVHAVVFAVPPTLGLLGGLPARPLLGVLAAHALLSEAVQHVLLPGRSGDPVDALADLAGLALGWALARALASPRRRRRGTPRASGGGRDRW
jgi:hypothetical protein